MLEAMSLFSYIIFLEKGKEKDKEEGEREKTPTHQAHIVLWLPTMFL